MTKLISLAIVLLFFKTVSGTNSPNDIFILAGQSNMAGRGGVSGGKWDGKVPPECNPSPSILRLDANHSWVEAHDPLHTDIDVDRVCGIGPGMAFANKVWAHGEGIGVVGLVPCAVGGTSIKRWVKGGKLYNQLVSRANAAVKSGGSIRAVLWFQGESDTVRKGDADAYGRRLKQLFSNIRIDLNMPSLQFIQVALAAGEGKFVETVRKAQLEIDLPNVKTVDAKGLPLNQDKLHLSTMGEVEVGLKLANAFLESPAKKSEFSIGRIIERPRKD